MKEFVLLVSVDTILMKITSALKEKMTIAITALNMVMWTLMENDILHSKKVALLFVSNAKKDTTSTTIINANNFLKIVKLSMKLENVLIVKMVTNSMKMETVFLFKSVKEITVPNTGGSTQRVNGSPNGFLVVKESVKNVMMDITSTQITNVSTTHHTAQLSMKNNNVPVAH